MCTVFILLYFLTRGGHIFSVVSRLIGGHIFSEEIFRMVSWGSVLLLTRRLSSEGIGIGKPEKTFCLRIQKKKKSFFLIKNH